MRLEKRVYLSMGSNIGEREKNLRQALRLLEQQSIRVVKRSSVYETAPQDVVEQPWFLNMAVECETTCFPLQLLAVLLGIERELGRVRAKEVRRGPRTIDLDILLFGNAVIDTPRLVVPHPRMCERRFVLEPLLEIAPALRSPRDGTLLSECLRQVAGQNMRKLAVTGEELTWD